MRMFEVTIGRSTIIGSRDDPPEITTGTLLDTRVREATEEERLAASIEDNAPSPEPGC